VTNPSDVFWEPICSEIRRTKCPVRVLVVLDDNPTPSQWSLSGLWIPVPGYLEAGGDAGPLPSRCVGWVELGVKQPFGGMNGVPASTKDIEAEAIRGLSEIGVEWSLVEGNIRIANPFLMNVSRG
jgi:hypothetical protein